jgi:hypothetical protein
LTTEICCEVLEPNEMTQLRNNSFSATTQFASFYFTMLLIWLGAKVLFRAL